MYRCRKGLQITDQPTNMEEKEFRRAIPLINTKIMLDSKFENGLCTLEILEVFPID